MAASSQSELLHEIAQFLYRAARYEDEHRYEDWESLWTDDGIYWVPANGENIHPEKQMSIIYDNRSRIGLRVRQLLTGKRHTQEPQSRLRRLISNIELLGDDGNGLRVGANAIVFETNQRGDTLWCARLEYVLRRVDGALRIAYKKVALVNGEKAIPTLSFLI
ncbi:MAG: aromatic-ring-hydroxylating dioxygenase subunit beta [Xanthobacteraceae bacterium]